MTDNRIHMVECSCGKRLRVTCSINPGFASYEEAFCPSCGKSLGEFREDYGLPDVEIV